MSFRNGIIICFLLIVSVGGSPLQAQSTQTIRGTVIDMNTGVPLIGATVVLLDHMPLLGTITDHQGYFNLDKVPLGRQGIQVDYLGYNTALRRSLDVTSGKAFTINIELEEGVILGEEAVVKARPGRGEVLNEMAQVSARSFNMEEAERYAGSWGDPARLVANFAGVQSPADQSNDIIIRGNSPAGLLWKMEGVSIYNPNHFGAIGSTGGPISMINNNLLANSDFYSGAFPAEFGNATSGVFDLNLRNGNNTEREFTAQVSFNGFEFGAEGPFTKGSNASYLLGYRYSSMGFFDKIGLNMGVPAIPFYQDLTFKADIPYSEKGRLTLFGMGGMNHIGNTEGESDERFYFQSSAKTGVAGIAHKHYFNSRTRLRTILSIGGIQNTGIDSSIVDGVMDGQYGQNFREQKLTLQSDLRRKLTRKDHIVAGLELSYIRANYRDSSYVPAYDMFFTLSNTAGDLFLLRSYINWKHRFNEKLQMVAGMHYQQVSLNSDLALEPRVSLKWKVSGRQELSLGYGLHSQAQPRTVYFSETLVDTLNLVYKQTNKQLGFTRSHQLVLGYQLLVNPVHRFKAELYIQNLFDVPVSSYPSHISMINYGGSFDNSVHDSLINEGEGWNMGLELTMERFFSNSFYYLATLSLFDSKYRASDGEVRNSIFNGTFIVNLLGGYEWKLRNQDDITVDGRLSWAGGLRTIPIDLEASREAGKTVRDYSRAYEERDSDYFRIDLRVGYQWNRPKSTWTFAADIQNLTNHINPFIKEYNAESDQIEQVSQLGIIPSGVIRVNF
ncbi:MAG: TonB-dependent receptor [Bacteroidetes bacterium]|nr:TonB-dependent receptor [Bacteroidota bacterium]